MESIRHYLKTVHHLSSYQIAQIFFLFKTLGSEFSKMLIMGILFHDRFLEYLFALGIMLCLRCSTGGLHFYTYLGCLATSVLYLWLALYIMPLFCAPTYVYLSMLLICIPICYIVGPVTSKYRPPSTPEKTKSCLNFTCAFIFIYALLLYIIPENKFIPIGFGVIILHTLQLVIAKIRKKGET